MYSEMSSRMYTSEFDSLLQTLSLLACSCHTLATQIRLEKAKRLDATNENEIKELLKLPKTSLPYINDDEKEDLLELSPQDKQLLNSRELYLKMINQAHSSKESLEALNLIVCHWSFEEVGFSDEVVRIINDGIDRSGTDTVTTYLQVMERFICIDDSLQQRRLDLLHKREGGILFCVSAFRSRYQPFSYNCIRCLVEMMSSNSTYRHFMLQKRDDWKWWDSWLKNYANREHSYYNSNSFTNVTESVEDKGKFFQKYLQLLKENNIEPILNEVQEEPAHESFHTNMDEGDFNMYENMQHANYNFSHVQEPEPGQSSNLFNHFGEEMQVSRTANYNVEGVPAVATNSNGNGEVIQIQEPTLPHLAANRQAIVSEPLYEEPPQTNDPQGPEQDHGEAAAPASGM
ncbi:hypothetical protein RFI_22316 [Reticulomyxa filosa]|uniref:Uncharacterized protein n=1 Tax=Reticulomyxa filosa TaxID=46433 RepID=X6MNN9_RETFI|nr:hypothetical protein RFI_22316 [Reticulomyxa filosa]|eukprot:ETO15047.1 hypothetical protein RFI_22316 [Reticulomyxa filosa]